MEVTHTFGLVGLGSGLGWVVFTSFCYFVKCTKVILPNPRKRPHSAMCLHIFSAIL
uniref:Uncharacterized protein n=1 Tax=Rhizophora mucronata TaxID=61149 RepID=A0A2P2PQL7_RHIMU